MSIQCNPPESIYCGTCDNCKAWMKREAAEPRRDEREAFQIACAALAMPNWNQDEMIAALTKISQLLDTAKSSSPSEPRPESIKKVLQAIIDNDTTKFRRHQKRADGKKPSEVDPSGTIWLTPKEIAGNMLKHIELDELKAIANER